MQELHHIADALFPTRLSIWSYLLIGVVLALIALAALYTWWFLDDKHWLATQLVFTGPPLLLAVASALMTLGALRHRKNRHAQNED